MEVRALALLRAFVCSFSLCIPLVGLLFESNPRTPYLDTLAPLGRLYSEDQKIGIQLAFDEKLAIALC